MENEFYIKMVACVPKMGLGVDLCHGKIVRHSTAHISKNSYPKLISQKENDLYNYFDYPKKHIHKSNHKTENEN